MAQAAGEVKVILSVDGTSYSDALDKAGKQLDQLKGKVADAGKATRKEMGEARGAIALVGEELGVHLPRHVRNFVAELPGVATAMSAAFNAVAVFALGAAIFEAGEKLAEFIKKNEEAAQKNAEAWRSIQAPMRDSNDELQLANDRLQNAISKIEGKPTNGLKQAIDEAIVSADKLGDHLNADLQKIAATLGSQAPGILARGFGSAGTGDVTEHSKELQGELDKIDLDGHNKLDALRKQGASEEQITEATKELNDKRKEAIDGQLRWANSELDFARAQQANRGFGDFNQDKRIGILTQYGGALSRMSDFTSLTQTNGDLTAHLGDDQSQAEALELSRQAAARFMQEFEFQRRRSRPFEDVNRNAQRLNADRVSGRNSNTPDNVATADEALNKILKDQADDVLHTGERWAQFNREQARGNEEAAIGAAKFDELRAHLAAATGAMSRHGEAVAMAAAHTAEYNAQREALEEQLSRIQGDASLTTVQRATQSIQVQNQIDALGNQRGMQRAQDDAAIEASTALGGLRSAAGHLAQEFTDASSIVANLFVESLRSFNDTLVHLLTTPHANGGQAFRDLGRSVFGDVSKTGLQYLEGMGLKAILGHDPTAKLGTKNNRMYTSTILEDGGAGGAGGILGKLASGAGDDGDSGSSKSGGSGILSQVFGALFGGGSGGGSAADGIDMSDYAGAAFANGGTTPTNMPFMVGERGPEIFKPTTSGSIVPNNKLGGSDIHIDARGASDPSMVEASVHRALRQYSSVVPAMALSTVKDYNSRQPRSSRIG